MTINQGAAGASPSLEKVGSIDKEELIAGTHDFDIADPSDNFRLKFNKELTKK